jgi:hypothetical protein
MNKQQWADLYFDAHMFVLALKNDQLESAHELRTISASSLVLDPEQSKRLGDLANRLTMLTKLIPRAKLREIRRWQWYQYTKD